MFKDITKYLFLLCALILHSISFGQTILPSFIAQDTVLAYRDAPYRIINKLTVGEGAELCIDPGVTIFLDSGARIQVDGGIIKAIGKADSTINFKLSETASPESRWRSISVRHSKVRYDEDYTYLSGNIMKHCYFQTFDRGVVLQNKSNIMVSDCEFEDFSFIALYAKFSDSCVFMNNTIHDTPYCGILIGSYDTCVDHRVLNNHIYDCFTGIFLSANQGLVDGVKIFDNVIEDNTYGIKYLKNVDEETNNSVYRNQIFSNNYGMDISGNYLDVRYNLLFENKTAIRVASCNNNTIAHNFIFDNTERAISFWKDASFNNVDSNRIYRNKTGVSLRSEDIAAPEQNNFRNNQFSDNQESSFFVEDGHLGSFLGNDIYNHDNSEEFINLSRNDIYADTNYWGTVYQELIEDIIYDYFDDSELGRVYVGDFAEELINQEPYDHDFIVTRKKIGDDVLLQWDKKYDVIFAGYKVYYYPGSGYSFDSVHFTVSDTSFLIKNYSLDHDAAVTVRNRYADNYLDILEGFESWYHFSIPMPYAGEDAEICANTYHLVSDALALAPGQYYWSTLGDGNFNDEEQLNVVYVPGYHDKINGYADLVLHQTIAGNHYADTCRVTIKALENVFAGNSTVIYEDSSLQMIDAEVGEYTDLIWSTSGDGHFDDPTSLNPTYFCGQQELDDEQVYLKLTIETPCGMLADSVLLLVKPTYDISGCVHFDNVPLQQGSCLLFEKNVDGSGYKAQKIVNIVADGEFHFKNLPESEYLVYAIPDPFDYSDYLPSYYVNKIHFGDAYALVLNDNIYDVDIHLQRPESNFPKGLGRLKGVYHYDDFKVYEKEIFESDWGKMRGGMISEGKALNMTVLLMSSTQKVLAWTLTDEQGVFTFDRLPYGTYYLYAEKAGYDLASMPAFELTPEHPVNDQIFISLTDKSIRISSPIAEDHIQKLSIFPNPGTGIFAIDYENPISDSYFLRVFNSKNQLVYSEQVVPMSKESFSHYLNISDLGSGLYFLSLVGERGDFLNKKITFLK